MKSFLMLSVLSLTACGTQSSAPNGNVTNLSEKDTKDESAAKSTNAMLIGSAKNLPTCTGDIEGQLIYAKDEKQFYFCSEKLWTKIDLSGKDGADGTNGSDGKDGLAKNGKDGTDGTNGIDGVDGVAGTNGTNGTNGINGAAAPVVDERIWIHPVTGIKWFVGHSVMNIYYSGNEPNLLSDNFICPVGSHSPDDDEFMDALTAGIWYKFSTFSPLLVSLGTFGTSVPYTYGPDYSVGTQAYYKFRVATNGVTISDSYNGAGYVTAKALCVTGD